MGVQILGSVLVNGTCNTAAVVTGYMDEPISRDDVQAIKVSVFEIVNGRRLPIDGFEGLAVAVADAMPATPHTGPPWNAEPGVNFLHVLPIPEGSPFTTPRAEYVVEYLLTPASGEMIVVAPLVKTLQ